MEKKQADLSLILFVCIYFMWSAYQSILVPLENSSCGLWVDIFIKGGIWLSPFLLNGWRKTEKWLVSPKKMFRTSFPTLPCISMLCATVAFLYTVRIVAGKQNTHVVWDHMFLLFSISASVIEETAFRGYFFNRQARSMGIMPAALLNGVLFAVFHYPSLLFGYGFDQLISLRVLMLFAVGVLFSLAFAKWKNLWLLIIVHSIWNILSYYFALAG